MLNLGFRVEDVLKEGKLTLTDIETIGVWLKNNGYETVTDQQIIQFILSCDGNLEFTKTTIQRYFKLRHNSPDIFNNRNVNNADIQSSFNIGRVNIIPRRTKSNNQIIFYKLIDSDVRNFNVPVILKIIGMLLDGSIFNYPPSGFLIVVDIEQMTFMHIFRANLGAISRFIQYLQEGLPVKLTAIHVINTNYIVNKFVSLVKTLMSPSLSSKVFSHAKGYDKEEFALKYIEKACLPEEYGGHLPPTAEIHTKTIDCLDNLREFFEAEEKQRTGIMSKMK